MEKKKRLYLTRTREYVDSVYCPRVTLLQATYEESTLQLKRRTNRNFLLKPGRYGTSRIGQIFVISFSHSVEFIKHDICLLVWLFACSIVCIHALGNSLH